MTKKNAIFFMLCFFLQSIALHAQIDTLFFDKYWDESLPEDALYYRLKPTQEGNGYYVNDFYKSGALQMAAFSLSDVEDIYDGKVSWYYETGQLKETSTYVNGIKDGLSVQYDSTGSIISEGYFKDNKPYKGTFSISRADKTTIQHYQEGVLSYEASYGKDSQSKVSAIIELKDGTNGKYYKVAYTDAKGQLIGNGVYNLSFEKQEGVFANYMSEPIQLLSLEYVSKGKVDSVPFYYRNEHIKQLNKTIDNQTVSIFFNQSGIPTDTLIYKDGNRYDGGFFYYSNLNGQYDEPYFYEHYEKGESHGPYILFHPNGKQKETGNYINNRKEGKVTFFNTIGAPICSGIYKDGRMTEGEFIVYRDNNNKKSYEKGKLKVVESYYPSGELQGVYYKDSLRIAYTTEGQEIARLLYKDGGIHSGVWLTFHPNGKLESKNEYEKGELVSLEGYDHDGMPKSKTIYTGDFTEKKIYYYPSGEIKAEVLVDDKEDEYVSYYSKSGSFLGKFETVNYIKNGDRYNFLGGAIIEEIKRYQNDEVVYEKVFSKTGRLLYEVDYNGKASYYNKWGVLIGEGTYANGEPYDGIIYTYKNKRILTETHMKNGVRHGVSKRYEWNHALNRNHLILKGSFNNGDREGKFEKFINGYPLKTITFVKNKKQGEVIFYDGQGNELSRAIYKDDNAFEGTFYTYARNGVARKENYREGLLYGEQITYNSNGETESVSFWEKGYRKEETVYQNGQAYQIKLQNNIYWDGVLPEGRYLKFYSQGNFSKKQVFNNDKYEVLQAETIFDRNNNRSLETSFFENGRKKSVVAYFDSRKDGEASYYDPNGEVISKGVYKKNIPLAGTFIYPSLHNPLVTLVLDIKGQQIEAKITEDGQIISSFNSKEELTLPEHEWLKKVDLFIEMIQRSSSYGFNLD